MEPQPTPSWIHTVSRAPRRLSLALAGLLVALTGCAAEPEADFEWDGVYAITSWTVSPSGCRLDGVPSLHEDMPDTHLVASATRDDAQVPRAIVAGACANPEACAQMATGGPLEAALGGLTPFEADAFDGEVYRSRTSMPHFDAARGVCVADVAVDALSSPRPGALHLEHRVFRDVAFAPRADAPAGQGCLGQEAALDEALASAPCSELTVIEAVGPEPLNPR